MCFLSNQPSLTAKYLSHITRLQREVQLTESTQRLTTHLMTTHSYIPYSVRDPLIKKIPNY